MKRSWFAALVLLCLASPAEAAELAPVGAFAPAAATGALTVRDRGVTREVDLAEIESLPHVQLALPRNPLGRNGTFSGVRLSDLLRHLGLADARQLSIRAYDAYRVILPLDEPGLDQAMFATRFDGQPIALAERGPFRLLWAHDLDKVVAGSAGTTKWIWNIAEIRANR